MEKYIPGIGISAGLLMLKWDLLGQHITTNRIDIKPGDTVNVFINFESILKNITTQKNLNTAVNFHKQKIVIELEAAILNLVANYRMFFKKNKCIPKIYLYHTDLNNDPQQMSVYNKYYRSYYNNRYMMNPQFRDMGKVINTLVVPEIELIMSYIPDCYFIKSKTFDGSLIPSICSNFSDNKNVIITTDVFDTLYLFNPNFATIYIKRRYPKLDVTSEIDTTVQTIIKDENPFDLTIFNSELYYRLLMSIKGSRIRNIRSAKGFGYGKFMKLLKEGIEKDIVLRDFESIDSVIQLFPDRYREDIKLAFQCTGLDLQYSLLNEIDIEGIQSQIVDKVDIASLEALNNQRFLEFPINLQGLLE
jgi:hypothetical protein